MRKIYEILADESGAVTIDWVVLTAALVGFAIAAIAAVETASIELLQEWLTAVESNPS